MAALDDIPAEWRQRCAHLMEASNPRGRFFVDQFPDETARIVGEFLDTSREPRMVSRSRVLVTGGSGFIGIHCIVKLLAAGYEVRATLRDSARETDVRAMLRTAGVDPVDRLSFAVAHLEGTLGGRRPRPAASSCCTLRRLFRPASQG